MKIISYNVGLLLYDLIRIPLFKTTPYISERLEVIPSLLIESEADIIALQEIYHVDHKQFLCHETIEKYPYIHYVHMGYRFSMENGLMFLSKLPLNDVKLINFKNIRLEEYLFAQTGYAKFSFISKNKKYFIYNIHLTAGGILGPEHKKADSLRKSQITQLLEEIENDVCDGHILTGDFNCGPKVSQTNYDAIVSAGFKNISSNALTWDPMNPLNVNGIHRDCPPQSIDHIFVNFDCDFETQICFDQPIVVTQAGDMTPSDHYGIETILSLS